MPPEEAELAVAVDLDGTQADLHTPAVERSSELDAYRPDEFGEAEWKEYKHRSSNVWHNHHEEIELVEPCAPDVMQALHDRHHVTVLTHRRNVDDQIRAWLAAHDIPYDDFIATHRDKAEFDMDVYVDDNPIHADDARVFLRDRPWNADVENGFDHRIDSLAVLLERL